MLLQAALAALRQVLSPALRAVLWKSLALTVAVLALLWFALTRLLAAFLASHPVSTDYPFLDSVAGFLAGAGLLVASLYILPAVAMLVASFFVDSAAEAVEISDFPGEAPGRALPWGQSLLYGLRFAGITLAVNLIALVLWFVPGVNVAAFFAANTYLLGRTYFELAAARYRPLGEAERMRSAHRGTVLAAGAILAGLLLVPIVNLITPIFGIALMVHVHKRLSGLSPVAYGGGSGRQPGVVLRR